MGYSDEGFKPDLEFPVEGVYPRDPAVWRLVHRRLYMVKLLFQG